MKRPSTKGKYYHFGADMDVPSVVVMEKELSIIARTVEQKWQKARMRNDDRIIRKCHKCNSGCCCEENARAKDRTVD